MANPTGSATLVTQTGRLAFGAIVGTTAGTATLLATANSTKRSILLQNSCDNPVTVTRNGVDFMQFEEKWTQLLEPEVWGKQISSGDVFGVYFPAAAPTVGSVRIVLNG